MVIVLPSFPLRLLSPVARLATFTISWLCPFSLFPHQSDVHLLSFIDFLKIMVLLEDRDRERKRNLPSSTYFSPTHTLDGLPQLGVDQIEARRQELKSGSPNVNHRDSTT